MLRPGHGLALLAFALLGIGVILVNSAGLLVVDAAGAPASLGVGDVLLGRTATLAAMAAALLFAGSRCPIRTLESACGPASPALWIVLGSVALLLAVQLPGLGREVNASRRWIDLGPLSFQPSEVVKWGLPIAIAWYCTRGRPTGLGRAPDDCFVPAFLAPMCIVGVLCALIAVEDLGTAALIGVVATFLLLAGGARIRHAVYLAPLAGAGLVAAVVAAPYRIARLRTFLDPYADAQDSGYQLIQSMAAISGGGLAGRGLGNGLQKFGYLPYDTSDFIFAIACEELGLVGAATIIVLYALFALCGLAVVERARRPFERLLALGIVLTFTLQALINLLVVTGLAPTKGIALPLISAGGTGWCMTAFAVGLLVAIDRQAEAGPAPAPALA